MLHPRERVSLVLLSSHASCQALGESCFPSIWQKGEDQMGQVGNKTVKPISALGSLKRQYDPRLGMPHELSFRLK